MLLGPDRVPTAGRQVGENGQQPNTPQTRRPCETFLPPRQVNRPWPVRDEAAASHETGAFTQKGDYEWNRSKAPKTPIS